MEAAIDRSNAIQERLWVELKAVAANNDAMVPTGLYIQALNAMFDLQAKPRDRLRERVPDVILWALYGIAAVSVGYAGFASGVERRRWRLPVYSIIVLAISVILLIEDLDRPASGFIVVDRRPMIDAAKAVAGYAARIEARAAAIALGVMRDRAQQRVEKTPTSHRTSSTTSTRPSTPPNPAPPYRPWA